MQPRAVDIEAGEGPTRTSRVIGTGAPRRRPRARRPALALFAAFSLVGCTLAFLVIAGRAGEPTRPALALARSIPPGETLTADHLRPVSVGDGNQLRGVRPEDAERLLGRVALVGMAEGTLLDPAFFAPDSALAPGQAVVGVTVKPGEGPRRSLQRGDTLLLVGVPPSDLAGVPGESGASTAWWGEVFDAAPIETADAAFGATAVSVRVAEAYAPEVAAAAAAGRLRLVLVAQIGPLDERPAFVAPPGPPAVADDASIDATAP